MYHDICFGSGLVDYNFKGICLLCRRWIDKTGDYEVEFIASARQIVPRVDHDDPVETHTDFTGRYCAQRARIRAYLHGGLFCFELQLRGQCNLDHCRRTEGILRLHSEGKRNISLVDGSLARRGRDFNLTEPTRSRVEEHARGYRLNRVRLGV